MTLRLYVAAPDDVAAIMQLERRPEYEVLVGRWDPPMPLHRYRLAGRLEEVRSQDLAFTADETAELLALHRVTLSRTALASLLQHTEGWAA